MLKEIILKHLKGFVGFCFLTGFSILGSWAAFHENWQPAIYYLLSAWFWAWAFDMRFKR